MSQHTPGPWTIEYHSIQDGKGGQKLAKIHNNEIPIATVNAWTQTQVANAQLIAAAPDLLEACKKMIQAFKNQSGLPLGLNAPYFRIRKAINKAEGK